MGMTTPTAPTGRRRSGIAALFVGVALVATTALAGCSAGSSNSSSESAQNRAAAPAALPSAAAGAAGAGASDGLSQNAPAKDLPGQTPADQPIQRSIIYTGSITLQVDDVPGAAATIAGLATGVGGFVGGDQRQLDADHSIATLTLRIPADRFTTTLDAIGRQGHERSRSVSTQDVTATVIDLDARIKTQQASVDRMRDLLAKAQSISDVATVEAELTKREADLESMEAQQRNLADLTALSTITVNLLGKDAAPPPPPKPAPTGFVGGLQKGWHAFVAVVDGLLVVLGALLPFIIVVGVPALLLWRWRRRRRTPALAPPLVPVQAAAPQPPAVLTPPE
jgi:hypothetical protein